MSPNLPTIKLGRDVFPLVERVGISPLVESEVAYTPSLGPAGVLLDS